MNRGLLAVASIGAILTLSEVANAAVFTVANFVDPNFTVTLGDKVFSNFSISGSSVDLEDRITIGFVTGVYQLDYTASGFGANPALTTSGTLKYKVTIPATFTNEFAAAGTNAQGNTLVGSFGKTLSATNLTPDPLNFVSTGGTVNGTFSAGTKTIDVTSAWTVSGGSSINSFSDQYIQNPLNPTPIAVPEPSAVLGLAALGLAGVVGRSVSRSLHNKRQ
ncbi:hypothetical protein NIES3806_24740 [Microcystis aeruginosa NIES-3806]|nr:hypothetical protein NIES3806_24740 [Microcystis aeruginosa NIES-3806]